MNDNVRVKEEIFDDEDNGSNNENMDIEEERDEPTLGPAALGLQRVGTIQTPKQTPSTPKQVLNARGMPARIRKKNKLFYDDELVNTPHHRVPSAKKQKSTPTPRKKTPSKYTRETPKSKKKEKYASPPPPLQNPDRKIGQKIGLRLRNLLKLPKAHKWVCYEWFYSDIDNSLFSGENDFSICLKESFPELHTRLLTRVEWTMIRRLMGKPRRCSQAFFNEERLELEKKRKKIRALQQRKVTDLASFKDLPSEIPLQLVIGTKVTARLRKPQDGLFTGTVDAFDTSNNTYRITFERQGLGTHSVPDYEILSNEPPETLSLSTFLKLRPRNGSVPAKPVNYDIKNRILSGMTYVKRGQKKDPLLSGLFDKPSLSVMTKIGGFPAKLLEKIVLVTKILNVKKVKVKMLNHLNTEAEKQNSYNIELGEDFERNYACVLMDLKKLNDDLQIFLDEIQNFCYEIAPEPSVAAMLIPSHLREKCKEEAIDLIRRYDNTENQTFDKQIYNLITDLTALMLQVKCLANSEQNTYELQVLQGSMEEIKRKLSRNNRDIFENQVEIYMKHIQIGLSQVKIKSEVPVKTY